MKKQLKISRFLPVFFILIMMLACWHSQRLFCQGEYLSPAQKFSQKILLVPLDGRPPCKQMVVNAGRIAGLEVITPPQELMDYYSQPADTKGLRQWLKENMSGSDAVILSIDELMYGGLLTAREKNAQASEVAELVQFLQELHQAQPQIPIYGFSILPRMTPQDTIDGYQERKDLIAYSRLVGKKAAGLEVDDNEINELAAHIPEKSLQKYLQRFHENEYLNQQLIDLAKSGVLARLVLGQDDGEIYSIPNIEKAALQGYIQSQGLSDEQVFLTHGADEIALTYLAEIALRRTSFRPRIFLDCNTAWIKEHYMPYMAVSLEACAREKVRLLGGTLAASAEQADCVLFISANDHEADTLSSRAASVKKLQVYQRQGIPVAVIDLSEHFLAEETLLPQLLEADFPVNSLAAYAGWNTASNSLGTALSEALLFLNAREHCQTKEDVTALAQSQTAFLQGRMLEDYFYLKTDIDNVNRALHKAGYPNVSDLNLEHNYKYANAMLQKGLADHLAAYQALAAVRAPFTITSPVGSFAFQLQNLTIDASYPWPRTFEIYLQATPELLSLSQR